MSYRFVKVTTFYSEYLRQYYNRNPEIVIKTYSEQMEHLMSDGFGWADYFKIHLGEIGVDAHEIIANVEPLQKAWGREHGIAGTTEGDIVVAQLKDYSPDVVMFEDALMFSGDWIKYLKEQVPSMKLAIGCCSSPYSKEDMERFRVFDFMLTGGGPSFMSSFIENGIKIYQVRHGFEKSLLSKININNNYPEVDFIFLGSLALGKGYHNKRKEILEGLLEAGVDLSIYSKINNYNPVNEFAKKAAYIVAQVLKQAGLEILASDLPYINKAFNMTEFPHTAEYSVRLKRAIRTSIFGIEMFKVLSHAKIGFNMHIDISGEKNGGNMRLFETTGVGTCLLTDWKETLSELFEIDKEVVAYKSVDECIEKVKWLLAHPIERQAIAKAGQARTLKDHTYFNRVLLLDEIIRKNLSL